MIINIIMFLVFAMMWEHNVGHVVTYKDLGFLVFGFFSTNILSGIIIDFF